jgi:hypothetical protein
MAEEEKEMTKAEVKRVLASLEEEIRKLSELGRAFWTSKLKERAILLLLRDMTGICLTDLKTVLRAIAQLDTKYLKKK